MKLSNINQKETQNIAEYNLESEREAKNTLRNNKMLTKCSSKYLDKIFKRVKNLKTSRNNQKPRQYDLLRVFTDYSDIYNGIFQSIEQLKDYTKTLNKHFQLEFFHENFISQIMQKELLTVIYYELNNLANSFRENFIEKIVEDLDKPKTSLTNK